MNAEKFGSLHNMASSRSVKRTRARGRHASKTDEPAQKSISSSNLESKTHEKSGIKVETALIPLPHKIFKGSPARRRADFLGNLVASAWLSRPGKFSINQDLFNDPSS